MRKCDNMTGRLVPYDSNSSGNVTDLTRHPHWWKRRWTAKMPQRILGVRVLAAAYLNLQWGCRLLIGNRLLRNSFPCDALCVLFKGIMLFRNQDQELLQEGIKCENLKYKIRILSYDVVSISIHGPAVSSKFRQVRRTLLGRLTIWNLGFIEIPVICIFNFLCCDHVQDHWKPETEINVHDGFLLWQVPSDLLILLSTLISIE